MWIWCSLLLLQVPQDPIKDWKVQHFERSKEGDLVLVAELWGDEAVPVDLEKKIFNVTKIRGHYFTEPKKPDEKSQRLDLTADRAHFNGSEKLLRLSGNVRVRDEDGSELESSELELRDHTFRTDQPVRLTNANVVFTGKGLEADEQLRRLTIREQGHVEMKREGYEAVLDSAGPMLVIELEKRTRALVTTSEGTRLRATTERGTADVTAKTAEILVGRKEKDVEFESIRLWDDVVAVAQGSTIRSKEAKIDPKRERTEFTGGVEGDLRPDPEKPPVKLQADGLIQQGDQVEARGNVRLRFTSGSGAPLDAQCDSFEFDAKTRAGVLNGGPWVRITTGENRILAARVLLPDADTLVLQGPKRVFLKQKEETFAITSAGDIAVSLASRRIKMIDRATVFTKDLRLFSDRVEVRLAPDGKEIEDIRAAGRVRVERRSEAATLFGDRLKIAGGRLTLRGWPYAVLERPDSSARMAEIRYDPKTQAVEAVRGKERIQIRFTEKRSK